jgi:hypothetical protein
MTTSSALPGGLRRPRRRVIVAVLLAALLIVALCWYLGADIWHALLFGAVLTTFGLLGTTRAQLSVGPWIETHRRNREGARNEVAELSWSLRGSWREVSPRALWRVQDLGRRRLAHRGLDIRDPGDRDQIEQLTGSRAYRVLVSRNRRPPTLRSVVHCLDVLDAIEAEPEVRT